MTTESIIAIATIATCIITLAAITTLADRCLKALISLRASQIILIYSLLALSLTASAYAQ
jgi:hypothetical protein